MTAVAPMHGMAERTTIWTRCMADYVPKLVSLPGAAVSPQVVLHRTLDKLEHIKSITITIQWNNDEIATDWSQMRVSELCMHAMHLDEQVKKTMFDGENKA